MRAHMNAHMRFVHAQCAASPLPKTWSIFRARKRDHVEYHFNAEFAAVRTTMLPRIGRNSSLRRQLGLKCRCSFAPKRRSLELCAPLHEFVHISTSATRLPSMILLPLTAQVHHQIVAMSTSIVVNFHHWAKAILPEHRRASQRNTQNTMN